MRTLYERIKEIRDDSGLNQEMFGKRIGLAKSSVSWVEKGKQAISENVIKNIMSEFCVNEAWLKEGTGEKYNEKLKKEKEYLHHEVLFMNSELLDQQLGFFGRINRYSKKDEQLELITSIEELYAILNIESLNKDKYFFYCESIAGMLAELRRYIDFISQSNELSKKMFDSFLESFNLSILEITNLFMPNSDLDYNNTGPEDNKKEIIPGLSADEENILLLYRQLNDRDKIKIEGIMEEKINEQSLIKKGQSSTSGHGEEAAAATDHLNYA